MNQNSEVVLAANIRIQVDNLSDIITRLAQLTQNADVFHSESDLIAFIAGVTQEQLHFFDKYMNHYIEDRSDIVYLWIETRLYTPEGDNIFISLLRQGWPPEICYKGFFVGTAQELSENCKRYNPSCSESICHIITDFAATTRLKTAKEPTNDFNIDVITEDDDDSLELYYSTDDFSYTENVRKIRQQLLVNPFCSDSGVAFFLNAIGTRIYELSKKNNSLGCCLFNQDESLALVNSGLMGEFGNMLYLLYRRNGESFVLSSFIKSKQDIVNAGFSRQQAIIELSPIRFSDDYILRATSNDFDLASFNISHIVKERYGRIKTAIGGYNIPIEQLSSIIQSELIRGLALLSADQSYARAIYSCTARTISWLLPCRILRRFDEAPELVLVINRQGDFYTIKTVFPYSEKMQDKMQALSLYSKAW